MFQVTDLLHENQNIETEYAKIKDLRMFIIFLKRDACHDPTWRTYQILLKLKKNQETTNHSKGCHSLHSSM